ncbi:MULTISPECIES: hypothetical protein [Micrococcaceae]|uniref:hypothetical protein n=1 Tax=Micrococcaceae TaxID=1268 RepID=UPI001036E7E9|nr:MULTISPECIES: hypothetical protein [Micrococcaceae]TAP28318.1 hypothetical protein EYR88_08465 [Arthrobacter sp. S41]UXN32885.1 hypothetical protein N6V40_05435 [Glutamicibacter sp. M10]
MAYEDVVINTLLRALDPQGVNAAGERGIPAAGRSRQNDEEVVEREDHVDFEFLATPAERILSFFKRQHREIASD